MPVSKLQPTPQEEVHNAILEDNATAEEEVQHTSATETSQAPHDEEPATRVTPFAESTNFSEATEDTTSPMDSSEATVSSSGPRFSTGFGRAGDSATAGRNVPKPTLYIGNLFFDVTEDDLVKELARFGNIKSARLVRDSRGLSKGFGYVEFESTEIAQKVVDNLNQQLFEGRRLNVAFAETDGLHRNRASRPVNPPSRTIFIGNMSFEMTDRDLNNLFKGIRNVVDVRVAIDRRTGQPRGFAHADFVDVKSAMEALKLLEGKETYGRKLRLDYSYGPSTAPKNTPR